MRHEVRAGAHFSIYEYIFPACCLLTVMAAALLTGDIGISPCEALRIIAGGPFAETEEAFKLYAIWRIRLPRVLCSVLAGGSLSLCGTLVQHSAGQPVAGPFIIGATPGAVFGVMCASLAGSKWLAGAPLLAGVGVPFIAWVISDGVERWRYSEKFTVSGLILGGTLLVLTVAMSSFFGDGQIPTTANIIGSFESAGWYDILPLSLSMCVLLLLCSMRHHDSGETDRLAVTITACFSAAITASRCGAMPMMGFVVSYTLARIWKENGRLPLCSSFLLGGALMALLDTVCRMRGEIPVGMITLSLGFPLFIIGLIRQRRIIPRE